MNGICAAATRMSVPCICKIPNFTFNFKDLLRISFAYCSKFNSDYS